MMLYKQEIMPWAEIYEASNKYAIDEHLIAAIMEKESDCNPYAMRYEPKWNYFYDVERYAQTLCCTVETERTGQQTSWGLMQVMGTVARELGFRGWFGELLDIDENLLYACRKLDVLFAKHKELNDVISAYNAGSPKKGEQGLYLNQSYVDDVVKNLKRLKNGGIENET